MIGFVVSHLQQRHSAVGGVPVDGVLVLGGEEGDPLEAVEVAALGAVEQLLLYRHPLHLKYINLSLNCPSIPAMPRLTYLICISGKVKIVDVGGDDVPQVLATVHLEVWVCAVPQEHLHRFPVG